MLDASELPLEENLELSKALLKECAELDIILEVEAGVVGGEEDGHDTSGVPAEKLYTTPEDMVAVYEALNRSAASSSPPPSATSTAPTNPAR
jgi:fructose-bisphosphate aldolase, class II